MIKINGEKWEIKHYPGGECLLELPLTEQNVQVTWFYKDDEFLPFSFLLEKLREQGKQVELTLPYFPYARMDRIKEEQQFFSLKYFVKQLAYLGVKKVVSYDVHSPVVKQLLNEYGIELSEVYLSGQLIQALIDKHDLNPKDLVIVYPDETAQKRFDYLEQQFDFGGAMLAHKHRDFNTGKILSIEVNPLTEFAFEGKAMLMVDDICSYGGTFLANINSINRFGDFDYYLVVTHCEEVIKNELTTKLKDYNFVRTLDWNA